MMKQINVEELSKSNEKIKMYKVDEELVFDDMKEVLKKLSYYYESDTVGKLESISMELIKKLKLIGEIHNNNVRVIEKSITNYKNLNQETERIFHDVI